MRKKNMPHLNICILFTFIYFYSCVSNEKKDSDLITEMEEGAKFITLPGNIDSLILEIVEIKQNGIPPGLRSFCYGVVYFHNDTDVTKLISKTSGELSEISYNSELEKLEIWPKLKHLFINSSGQVSNPKSYPAQPFFGKYYSQGNVIYFKNRAYLFLFRN